MRLFSATLFTWSDFVCGIREILGSNSKEMKGNRQFRSFSSIFDGEGGAGFRQVNQRKTDGFSHLSLSLTLFTNR